MPAACPLEHHVCRYPDALIEDASGLPAGASRMLLPVSVSSKREPPPDKPAASVRSKFTDVVLHHFLLSRIAAAQ